MDEKKATEANRDRPEDYSNLTYRAQRGDKAALSALKKYLDHGNLVEVAGNLARKARETLVENYCGNNLLVKEGLNRKMAALQTELAGTNSTPLENLLVDRVVTCWLHLHHLELTHASKDSMALDLADYYQRCITSAQKRYLSAIKTLAQIRRLGVPVLQVNIARKQVNVVGTSPSATEEAKQRLHADIE